MMIVQMDKMYASPPSSRDLAQRLYDKNIELENRRRRSAQARVPSDPNAWQQMRENYEGIILEDHTFSEQHNVEYSLWQLHYRRIEEFRVHFSAALASTGSTTSQSGKGPTRPDRITKIRLQFKTFLSEATGFYHDLILKIRAKYGLPLGYFSDDSDDQVIMDKDGKRSFEVKKGLISCHRCWIYLGDLARYKGLYGEGDSKSRDYAAASSCYLQAASLWPSSGNPHHQLAILATYSGDELVAVYRYFRSLAVDSPFSTARDNLIVAFEKNRQSYSQLRKDIKASAVKESPLQMSAKGRGKVEAGLQSKEAHADSSCAEDRATSIQEKYRIFCITFVRLNGLLFTRTSLETFGEVLSLVSDTLHELLSSGPQEELNFGTDAIENRLAIVRLISILTFTVHNVNREAEGQTYAEIVQRMVLFQNALTAVFKLMGNILKRCVQLSDPSSSFLLPGILVFVEWLACCPDLAAGTDVDDKQAVVRSNFWDHCISLLNKLLSNGLVSIDDEDETCFFNMSRYDEGETENRLALWEDFELRGFLPLQPAQTVLDFSRKHFFGGDGNKERPARVKRILAAGKVLANIVRVNKKAMSFDLKLKKFVIGVEPLVSEDIMLTSHLETPKLNGRIQEIPNDLTTNLAVMQPGAQLYLEGEDEEEEVIVFKPTVTEKQNDVIVSKWTPHEALEPGQNVSIDDPQFYSGPVLASHGDFCERAAFDAGSQPPMSVANVVPQHLQLYQSHSSMWLGNQQASLFNGLKDLSFLENGHVIKPGLQEIFSVNGQQSINTNSSVISYSQPKASGSVIQPKIDTSASSGGVVMQPKIHTIASSGVNQNCLAVKPYSALPLSSRKTPVNRPVRHLGPPPGFRHVPPKQVNEPILGSGSIGENPLMDNYSWLDGYQLPSSVKGLGLNQSINQPLQLNPQYISKSNGFVGTVSFPFPGKQAPTVQYELDKQNAWQDHQIVESLNLHNEQLQQKQLMKGSQQFIPPPEQYQGQSIWAGRYFV